MSRRPYAGSSSAPEKIWFWLFDLERNTRHNPEAILSQFSYAKMRYRADVFLVDRPYAGSSSAPEKISKSWACP